MEAQTQAAARLVLFARRALTRLLLALARATDNALLALLVVMTLSRQLLVLQPRMPFAENVQPVPRAHLSRRNALPLLTQSVKHAVLAAVELLRLPLAQQPLTEFAKPLLLLVPLDTT